MFSNQNNKQALDRIEVIKRVVGNRVSTMENIDLRALELEFERVGISSKEVMTAIQSILKAKEEQSG